MGAQDDVAGDFIPGDECTRAIAGSVLLDQFMFVCDTCKLLREEEVRREGTHDDEDEETPPICICQCCADTCHAGHEVYYVGNGPCTCDCMFIAPPNSKEHKCCLVASPASVAHEALNEPCVLERTRPGSVDEIPAEHEVNHELTPRSRISKEYHSPGGGFAYSGDGSRVERRESTNRVNNVRYRYSPRTPRKKSVFAKRSDIAKLPNIEDANIDPDLDQKEDAMCEELNESFKDEKLVAARGRSYRSRNRSGFASRLRSRSRSMSMSRVKGRRASMDGAASCGSDIRVYSVPMKGEEKKVERTPPRRTGSLASSLRSSRSAKKASSGGTDTNDAAGWETFNKYKDIVGRHQLAMEMEMMELLEIREKEASYWKSMTLSLKKESEPKQNEDGEQSVASKGMESKGEGKDPAQKKIVEKVSILEKEVHGRDEQIDLLREMVKMQEKTSQERTQLLEDQLETMTRLQAKVQTARTAAEQHTTPGPNGSPSFDEIQAQSQNPEVSCLDQLLSQNLAEKDRLQFENDQLRSLIMDQAASNNAKETVYLLTCRNCPGKHFISNTSKGDLKQIARAHFSTVWKVVNSSYGKGKNEFKECSIACDFGESSLAHHLADHCQHMVSEKAVIKWCKKNVKLEKMKGFSSPDHCEF
ncbi:hypothetical protein ACHAWF_016026 [Thalassiosira exigua]